MKQVKTIDAVGAVVCHDMTRIVPGDFKGVAFKKGHVIQQEDIPVLLSMGKEHIYVWEHKPGFVHEDQVAERLAAISMGPGTKGSDIREGKMNILASLDGVLKVETDCLDAINALDQIMVATCHTHTPVKMGETIGATRVIPLIVEEKKVASAEGLAGDKKLLSVIPYKAHRIGIVTTGSEVYKGRIQDAFGPVIRGKAEEYGMEVLDQVIVDDQVEGIVSAIKDLEDRGATLIICTGGMSVDPDDRTPTAIQASGADIVSYGAPVLPGAMFLLSYKGDMPILGLPGCVMYAKRTIFDLVFPRILTGEKLTAKDLSRLGHGGLCLDCPVCHFPKCSFGKGR